MSEEYSQASELDADCYDAEFRISRLNNQDAEVPPCTCNSPYIHVHASWCEQFQFWNF
jgi:hypothetical protein